MAYKMESKNGCIDQWNISGGITQWKNRGTTLKHNPGGNIPVINEGALGEMVREMGLGTKNFLQDSSFLVESN